MDAHKELVDKLMNCYSADQSVLGVILVGSAGKGYHNEHSDVDLEVVVTEERYNELQKNFQKFIHTEKYDVIFTTIDVLQQVKQSGKDVDHWWYKDCPVLLDKTGKLKGVLREITRYDVESRLKRLKHYYLGFWENSLYSMSCLRHNNDRSARIYAALAMQELIRLLFNFNNRWAPKMQWAFREIKLLKKKPANIESQIESILIEPDSSKLSILWNEIAKLLREEKYSWVNHLEKIL